MQYDDKDLTVRARATVEQMYGNRDYTEADINALTWHTRHFYMDKETYKSPFNLRIVKKFDSKDMDRYFERAGKYTNKQVYESTVYSADGEFYFGFHYG